MEIQEAQTRLETEVTRGVGEELLGGLMERFGSNFRSLMDGLEPEEVTGRDIEEAIEEVRIGLMDYLRDEVLQVWEDEVGEPREGLVKYEVQEVDGGKVGVIKFDDGKANIMTEEMAIAFRRTIEEISDNKPDVLILTGEGRSFSAGGDLDMIERRQTQKSAAVNAIEMRAFYDCFLNILDLKVPIIAAVNGAAIGAGLGLVCACDKRIAVPDARLGFSFEKMKLTPGMGCTFFPHRCVEGGQYIDAMLADANEIDARQGALLGIIQEIADPAFGEELMEKALAMAREILSTPGEIESILHNRLSALEVKEALDRESVLQGASFLRTESREALLAFRERLASRRRG